ncbi:MAG: hypothetical protein FJY85_16815, partial [Deltaproteobacteria bacterium]|nr:hypothetical protein [Deltaproteobacteria bacterium]
ELQKRLGSYADTQDRLEAIHGELSELKAFQEKQEEYKSVPPLPVVDQMSRTGREHLVERERVMGTVDPVLFNLFHNERNARGVTVSRMLDIVLWKYFGKPKLSFQIIDDPSPFSDSGGTSG